MTRSVAQRRLPRWRIHHVWCCASGGAKNMTTIRRLLADRQFHQRCWGRSYEHRASHARARHCHHIILLPTAALHRHRLTALSARCQHILPATPRCARTAFDGNRGDASRRACAVLLAADDLFHAPSLGASLNVEMIFAFGAAVAYVCSHGLAAVGCCLTAFVFPGATRGAVWRAAHPHSVARCALPLGSIHCLVRFGSLQQLTMARAGGRGRLFLPGDHCRVWCLTFGVRGICCRMSARRTVARKKQRPPPLPRRRARARTHTVPTGPAIRYLRQPCRCVLFCLYASGTGFTARLQRSNRTFFSPLGFSGKHFTRRHPPAVLPAPTRSLPLCGISHRVADGNRLRFTGRVCMALPFASALERRMRKIRATIFSLPPCARLPALCAPRSVYAILHAVYLFGSRFHARFLRAAASRDISLYICAFLAFARTA